MPLFATGCKADCYHTKPIATRAFPTNVNDMNDDQLLRYSRHILLPELDIAGQERLSQARVLVIGMGGLGSPVALYLAASGVGALTLVDFDYVDLSNLQRQIMHRTCDIKRLKTESATDAVQALNPLVEITSIPRILDADELLKQVKIADVVVDASDNLATRLAINAACVRAATPLVIGAAIRLEGQVLVWLPAGEGACYRCLYREAHPPLETCTQSGVLAPLVGIIGSIQATEVIKILTGIGKPLDGRLLALDAAQMEWRSLRVKRWQNCPVCGLE